MASSSSEASWGELLGSKNWDKLLDPLDISMLQLILKCGDFCQATYDSFVNDQNSKYCGASRYARSSLFHKVMLDSPDDYEIASFLYATARVSVPEAFLLHSLSRESWDRESNWIGYIATTSDVKTKTLGRREIFVVLRGTTRNYEWVNILGAKLTSVDALLSEGTKGTIDTKSSSSSDDEDDNNGWRVPRAMLGWVTMYTANSSKSAFTKLSLRFQLIQKIKELVERYKHENPSVVLTGHSLGAALAVLSGFDLAENAVASSVPIAAIVFGCPQVGNHAFDERVKSKTNLKILHVRNVIDLLTHYPGPLLGYVDTGIDFVIDTRKSPYLKDSTNPGDWHNLQAMLHVVAGWGRKKGEFKLRVKRSLALVNKSCDFLKDEYLVPASWWVVKNKGLIKTPDSEWVMAPPEEEPLPEF